MGFKHVARTDPNNRVALLALKYPKKDGPPILPLLSDDPDAFSCSPFAEILDTEVEDVGEAMVGFMGPGPWTIRKDLPLLGPGGVLHVTNKNRGSNILVGHMLKSVFRVECGDDEALDPVSGKWKLFDIVVQTPVHILLVSRLLVFFDVMCSYKTNGRWHAASMQSRAHVPARVLPPARPRLRRVRHLQASPQSQPFPPRPLLNSTPSAGSIAQCRWISGVQPTHHHASLSLSAVLPSSYHHLHHAVSVVSDQSASSRLSLSAEATSPSVLLSVQEHHGQQPHHQQQHSTPEQFEQLIAGQETEEGEALPSYEAAVTIKSALSSGGVSRGGGGGTATLQTFSCCCMH